MINYYREKFLNLKRNRKNQWKLIDEISGRKSGDKAQIYPVRHNDLVLDNDFNDYFMDSISEWKFIVDANGSFAQFGVSASIVDSFYMSRIEYDEVDTLIKKTEKLIAGLRLDNCTYFEIPTQDSRKFYDQFNL